MLPSCNVDHLSGRDVFAENAMSYGSNDRQFVRYKSVALTQSAEMTKSWTGYYDLLIFLEATIIHS
jgi:hypothetical protein